MARVTVEDCLEHVDNRFSLVHLASLRSKQLKKGVRPLVACDNREVVTALREIADGKIQSNMPHVPVEGSNGASVADATAKPPVSE